MDFRIPGAQGPAGATGATGPNITGLNEYTYAGSAGIEKASTDYSNQNSGVYYDSGSGLNYVPDPQSNPNPTGRSWDRTLVQLNGPPDNQPGLVEENPPTGDNGSGISNRGPALQFRPQSNLENIPLSAANPSISQFYVSPFSDQQYFNYYEVSNQEMLDPSGVEIRRNIFLRTDNKQPFFNPNGLEELTKKDSLNQVPNLNVTSPDTFFNVTIGNEYCNPLPGFGVGSQLPAGPPQNFGAGALIPGNKKPNKYTGSGSLTVAQNNWSPDLEWSSITPGGGNQNPFDDPDYGGPPGNPYPPYYDPNLPFYNKWNGANFPADSKFSKVADNLRLTSTTHIFTRGKQGPRSSLTFYAYNIPDWRRDTNEPIFPDQPYNPGQPASDQWFNGGIPNENAPYPKQDSFYPSLSNANPDPNITHYSHTVGGAGIVLEPSGNVLKDRIIDPARQRGGYEVPMN